MFANKKLTLVCPKCGSSVFRTIVNPRSITEEGREVCSNCAFIISKTELLQRARKKLRGMIKDLRSE